MRARKSGIKMPGDQQHFARINLLDIKALIRKKLGAPKADKYFELLNRLLSRNVNKSEFDALCVAVIGRQNIRLHNFLISSILRNACLSKAPPSKGVKPENLQNAELASKEYQRSCLQSLCRDAFPSYPTRGRTPVFRDRSRFKEKPQALSMVNEQQSATELLSLGSRPPSSVEDGEEVNQTTLSPPSPGVRSKSAVVTAPLGIPVNVKAPRKVLASVASSGVLMESCQGRNELPDTHTLRRRLERKLEEEGLEVPSDCVNLLNSSIDVFLKRLIKPSLGLAASRTLNGNWYVGCSQGQRQSTCVTMLDFRIAMELNPTVLGEDWPRQLEKISVLESENCLGS